jgi:RNA polymerase sigma factor (sigma-70 family)
VADSTIAELEGLRALARALAGDDADDLVQDAAIAALEHPPALDRPVRPWLAAVLRNRRRMNVRADARRRRRELAIAGAGDPVAETTSIDRARVLERLSRALVELDEPFRTAVVRRYLDGQTSAEIARALGVPAGTVRWRLKTGLARLRAALDDDSPDWRGALIPMLHGAAIVKTKLSLVVIVIALLLAGAWWRLSRPTATAPQAPPAPVAAAPVHPLRSVPLQPGQARATSETVALPGGRIRGRVVNWSTGDGVPDADVTFTSAAGAVTIRSGDDGAFELAPNEPGAYTLATISAAGFLPYAPELDHSTIHVQFQKGRTVDGITAFVYPALDYHGLVVDAANAPVAGAHVALLGTPAGEQAESRVATEWTTAGDGTFTFHAPDEAVFEASKGAQHGWARLDGGVTISKHMTIHVASEPARDSTITGVVVDDHDQPLADVLVRAQPLLGGLDAAAAYTAEPAAGAFRRNGAGPPRATTFATSGADGRFALDHLDRHMYVVEGELEGRASSRLRVAGATANVKLVLGAGVVLAGTVVTVDHDPVPSFTLAVYRRDGAARRGEIARSIVDPLGHFDVRVAAGDFDLVATAAGWAPSSPLHVAVGDAGASALEIVVRAGVTVRGTVRNAATGQPVPYARVMRETTSAGASAQPSNVGTVTRADGSFELTGLPSGPVSLTIGADSYHPKIEGGLAGKDGDTLGPLAIALTPLAPGEEPTLELVGIGAQLTATVDGLIVQRVIDGGGAQAAGIIAGDLVVTVDGADVKELGLEGSLAKIRGVEGTTVAIGVKRGDQVVTIVCTRAKLNA